MKKNIQQSNALGYDVFKPVKEDSLGMALLEFLAFTTLVLLGIVFLIAIN